MPQTPTKQSKAIRGTSDTKDMICPLSRANYNSNAPGWQTRRVRATEDAATVHRGKPLHIVVLSNYLPQRHDKESSKNPLQRRPISCGERDCARRRRRRQAEQHGDLPSDEDQAGHRQTPTGKHCKRPPPMKDNVGIASEDRSGTISLPQGAKHASALGARCRPRAQR